MSEIVTVTFNGVTAEIKPVQDGMYDLNDIWRTFKLPEKKRPSEWRHRERKHLTSTGYMRSLEGKPPKTLASGDTEISENFYEPIICGS